MKIKSIIDRVVDNTSSYRSANDTIVSAAEIARIKRDLLDLLNVIYRRSMSIKRTKTFSGLSTTLGTDQKVELPSDYFLPEKVVFKNSATNTLVLKAKEMSYEEYMNWIPNAYPANDENVDYDGYIGYTFDYAQSVPEEDGTDERKEYLRYKIGLNPNYYSPVITSMYAELYYTSCSFNIDILDSSSDVATNSLFKPAYIDIIINGLTVKELKRQVRNAKSDVEIQGILAVIGMYKADFDNGLAELAAHGTRTAETIAVKQFDLLNDPSMLLP